MQSFPDTDGDGIPNVPSYYATAQGRKIIEDSTSLGDLLKNPNKYAVIMVVAVVVLLAVLIGLILLIVKLIKTIRRRRKPLAVKP